MNKELWTASLEGHEERAEKLCAVLTKFNLDNRDNMLGRALCAASKMVILK